MVLLQLASGLLIVAGLVAMAFGYNLRDAAFGQTAFVSGLIGFGAGIMSLALAMSVRELRRIAELLDLSAPPPLSATLLDLSRTAPSPRSFALSADAKARAIPTAAATESSRHETRRPRPQRAPRAQRPDAEILRPEPVRASLPDPRDEAGHRPRIDERTEIDAAEDAAFAARQAPRAWPDHSWERPAEDEPAMIEAHTIAAASEPAEKTPAPAVAPTLVKSGQVNDMTYSLYSDGSIEAALPTGTMRFATLNQLRDYLNGEIPSPPAISLV